MDDKDPKPKHKTQKFPTTDKGHSSLTPSPKGQ